MLPSPPPVECAQKSDPGRDPEKQVNEDACGHRATLFGYLSIVCDGMGGHQGGREASRLALATVFEVFEGINDPQRSPRDVLRLAIEEANRKVFGLGAGDLQAGRPGSTVVAVLIHDFGTEVAHVGDSRCYHVHESKIAQVTKDHSMVQQLVDAQLLKSEEAASHPEANKIVRALGIGQEVDVDLKSTPILHIAGDLFVLCSDGLSDLVEPSEILKIASSMSPAQAAGQLVTLANAKGGHDNITVQILRVRESARAPASIKSGVAPTVDQTRMATTHPSSARAWIAIPLFLLGLAIAFYVFYTQWHERGGKRHRHGTTFEVPPQSEPFSHDEVQLAPEPAPPPSLGAEESGEPILPLTPSPTMGAPSKRK